MLVKYGPPYLPDQIRGTEAQGWSIVHRILQEPCGPTQTSGPPPHLPCLPEVKHFPLQGSFILGAGSEAAHLVGKMWGLGPAFPTMGGKWVG